MEPESSLLCPQGPSTGPFWYLKCKIIATQSRKCVLLTVPGLTILRNTIKPDLHLYINTSKSISDIVIQAYDIRNIWTLRAYFFIIYLPVNQSPQVNWDVECLKCAFANIIKIVTVLQLDKHRKAVTVMLVKCEECADWDKTWYYQTRRQWWVVRGHGGVLSLEVFHRGKDTCINIGSDFYVPRTIPNSHTKSPFSQPLFQK
jgi:hypothetical protein